MVSGLFLSGGKRKSDQLKKHFIKVLLENALKTDKGVITDEALVRIVSYNDNADGDNVTADLCSRAA